MQVTERIHALKIQFKIPVAPDVMLERFVYVYLIFGRNIYLIDSGVAGCENTIYEYIESQGRKPGEISALILTHAHPDHIGAAMSIKEFTNCRLLVHQDEVAWVENTQKQFEERPVPGFSTLVAGSTYVDEKLQDGDFPELDEDVKLKIIHTPEHSRGSVSILCESESALFTGDVLIAPGDLPIYENISDLATSIHKLQAISNINILLSSWETPIEGSGRIKSRIDQSLQYLNKIHNTIRSITNGNSIEPMELCRQVVNQLGLPPAAVNPLVAKGFVSSLAIGRNCL